MSEYYVWKRSILWKSVRNIVDTLVHNIITVVSLSLRPGGCELVDGPPTSPFIPSNSLAGCVREKKLNMIWYDTKITFINLIGIFRYILDKIHKSSSVETLTFGWFLIEPNMSKLVKIHF